MKKTILLLIIAPILTFTGCATLFSGSTDEVHLSSEPSGAKVFINGHERGTTPITLALRKNKDYNIEFVKEGYRKKTWYLSHSIGAGWIILDVLLGLVGIIVDAATGNWYGLDEDSYRAILEPEK